MPTHLLCIGKEGRKANEMSQSIICQLARSLPNTSEEHTETHAEHTGMRFLVRQ